MGLEFFVHYLQKMFILDSNGTFDLLTRVLSMLRSQDSLKSSQRKWDDNDLVLVYAGHFNMLGGISFNPQISLVKPLVSIIQRRRAFPSSSVSKGSACSAGDPGSIPGLGRSPGEGNGNPLQYPCLENLMNREAWWAAVHGVAKSQTPLSD